MRKIINFFKSFTITQVVIFTVVLSVIIVYVMTKYVDDPKDPATELVSNTIKDVKSSLGNSQQQQTNSGPTVAGIDPKDYNAMKERLKLKDAEILAIKNINAKFKDSIKLARIELDDAKNKVWTWEQKKESGSVIKATMSEKDSILHPEIDVKLATTDYVDKGGIFKKDRYYTDWYSPDQNIKVNGAQTWRKETIVKPKRLGLGLQAGYGITQDLKPSMYIGLGFSYNFANF